MGSEEPTEQSKMRLRVGMPTRPSRICELAVPRPLAGRCLGRTDARPSSYANGAVASGRLPQSNSVPSIQMRCRMTAIRRARATIAFLCPRRRDTCAAQAFSADHRFTRVSRTCAAS